jgi:hypothetical protein
MPLTAEEKMRRQQEKTQQIAEAQQRAAGYHRTPGYDPTPTPRQRYVPEAQRPTSPDANTPLGVSQGVISTPEQERRRREAAAAGTVIDNSYLK